MSREERDKHHLDQLEGDRKELYFGIANYPVFLSLIEIYSPHNFLEIEHWWSSKTSAVGVVLFYWVVSSISVSLYAKRPSTIGTVILSWMSWVIFYYFAAIEQHVVPAFLTHLLVFGTIGRLWIYVEWYIELRREKF